MQIYCCACGKDVEAYLTYGEEVYPHRKDLCSVPFWRCPGCRNFVGCHYKTKDRTRPLGCIPSDEVKNARKHIHALLDPLWKSGAVSRGKLYSLLSHALGYEYHTGGLKTVEEGRRVYRTTLKIKNELTGSMRVREA